MKEPDIEGNGVIIGRANGIRFTALGVMSVRKFSNMRWSIAVSSRHTNYSTSAKIFLV